MLRCVCSSFNSKATSIRYLYWIFQ